MTAVPYRLGAVALAGLFVALSAADAQPAPPGAALPGRADRDQLPEPRPASREGLLQLDRDRFAEQAPAGADRVSLVLSEVRLLGNTVVPTAELVPLWQGQIGKTVTLADLFAIAARISAAYRARGYVLSQAVVRQQELDTSAARVQIQVLEGFIERVRVSEGAPAGLKDFLGPVQAQRPAHLATLERQLLLLNELPGVQAMAALKAGSSTNATDLDLVVQRVPGQGSLAAHNRVSPALGSVRYESDAAINGLFGDFDRHALRLGTSGDWRFNQLAYALDLPVGINGLRLSAGFSASESEPAVAIANIDTSSRNLYAGLAYPVVRSRLVNLSVRGQLAAYNNASEAEGVRTSDDRMRVARVGITADLANAMGGITLLDLEFSKGLPGLGGSKLDDPLINGVQPNFARVSGYAAHLQQLGGSWNLLIAVSAQASGDRLPAAEQFGLGGEVFLRGYDPSEAIGERGHAGKLELRFNAEASSTGLTWYSFIDSGQVSRKRLGDADQKASLTSLGTGIRFSTASGVRGYLEIAKPVKVEVASKQSDRARLFAGLGFGF